MASSYINALINTLMQPQQQQQPGSGQLQMGQQTPAMTQAQPQQPAQTLRQQLLNSILQTQMAQQQSNIIGD